MIKVFKKGEIICNEGDNNYDFYIVMDGTVGIYKGNVLIKEFSKKGTIIGEMSVILKLPRTATIRAVTDISLLVLNADLDQLMQKNPDIIKKIIKNLAERLRDITDDYYHLAEKIYTDDMK
ncbi:MAG: cyclic nucleotide-binding domain-containing protein [bacterium]